MNSIYYRSFSTTRGTSSSRWAFVLLCADDAAGVAHRILYVNRIVLRGADRGANGSGSSHAALSTRAWEIARRKMAICTPQY